MVISFSSIKGGTGKTSICIHVANYCAAAGYRVLVIDFDVQNSLSFYYLDELSVTERKNLALALNTKDLVGNIVPSNCFGIDILASSFSLINLRTIGANTLRRMIAEAKPGYDFIFIDCAPTYDNLVQNAIGASDLIFTPVRLSQFDFKGALFYRDQITQDTDRIGAWRIIFNFYKAPRTKIPNLFECSMNLFSEKPSMEQSFLFKFLKRPCFNEASILGKRCPTPQARRVCSTQFKVSRPSSERIAQQGGTRCRGNLM